MLNIRQTDFRTEEPASGDARTGLTLLSARARQYSALIHTHILSLSITHTHTNAHGLYLSQSFSPFSCSLSLALSFHVGWLGWFSFCSDLNGESELKLARAFYSRVVE